MNACVLTYHNLLCSWEEVSDYFLNMPTLRERGRAGTQGLGHMLGMQETLGTVLAIASEKVLKWKVV